MEAIKTKGIARNGMLTVVVPQRFEEQELEVIVLTDTVSKVEAVENEREWPDTDTLRDTLKPENWKKLSKEEKMEVLKLFAGSARYPNTPTNKYEVYEQ